MAEIIQRTAEWHQVRLGKVTASRIADVTAKTKTGYGAGRSNYLAELVAERLTGASAERYVNAVMQWGTDQEPDARMAYEFSTDVEVEEIGFVHHPRIAMSGASPDGLVGSDGLVEIKCPNTATHIDTLRGASIPSKYVGQMMWQMACTGRGWCDFVSYDPRMPHDMRLFVQRLHRDDALIADLEKEVSAFLAELDSTVADLVARYRQKEAA